MSVPAAQLKGQSHSQQLLRTKNAQRNVVSKARSASKERSYGRTRKQTLAACP